ncbi:Octaprenyl-diphosphate synthase [Posidoniimonas corsicana]|uniref:Octaprenyl-diphosphate synthase n=1 Tax=Posidoniimonas corsicana TaxID=1938618 RepID=A0A5C5VH21_9BACT|nr:polyprenyl synthetase family protein [Posidoniimonas corsicana]TWT37293.1 Octaprenyl-diphosphate synthase [Posidoniimonas corsicana]
MSQADQTLAHGATDLRQLLSGIADDLAAVERRLQSELHSRVPQVDEVVRHGYRLGGKRLRPALVLLAGQAAGGLTDEHLVLSAVVEMIHTATLVHDDVLDEADLRRHEDTVNARWGNETSVLLGDFLFSHAFYLASTTGSAEACQTIGRATNTVCEGEMQQTLSEGDFDLSQDDYLAIITAKTAELCACCCELGARQAGADDATVERFASFGRNLGVAFQIADDLLDLMSDEEATGKTTGADLAKRKMTLPLIHARDALVNGPRANFVDLLATADVERIRAQVKLMGSLDYANRTAADYARRAAADLAELPDNPALQSLVGLANFAAARSS